MYNTKGTRARNFWGLNDIILYMGYICVIFKTKGHDRPQLLIDIWKASLNHTPLDDIRQSSAARKVA